MKIINFLPPGYDLTLVFNYFFMVFAFGFFFGSVILGFFRFLAFGFVERKDA